MSNHTIEFTGGKGILDIRNVGDPAPVLDRGSKLIFKSGKLFFLGSTIQIKEGENIVNFIAGYKLFGPKGDIKNISNITSFNQNVTPPYTLIERSLETPKRTWDRFKSNLGSFNFKQGADDTNLVSSGEMYEIIVPPGYYTVEAMCTFLQQNINKVASGVCITTVTAERTTILQGGTDDALKRQVFAEYNGYIPVYEIKISSKPVTARGDPYSSIDYITYFRNGQNQQDWENTLNLLQTTQRGTDTGQTFAALTILEDTTANKSLTTTQRGTSRLFWGPASDLTSISDAGLQSLVDAIDIGTMPYDLTFLNNIPSESFSEATWAVGPASSNPGISSNVSPFASYYDPARGAPDVTIPSNNKGVINTNDTYTIVPELPTIRNNSKNSKNGFRYGPAASIVTSRKSSAYIKTTGTLDVQVDAASLPPNDAFILLNFDQVFSRLTTAEKAKTKRTISTPSLTHFSARIRKHESEILSTSYEQRATIEASSSFTTMQTFPISKGTNAVRAARPNAYIPGIEAHPQTPLNVSSVFDWSDKAQFLTKFVPRARFEEVDPSTIMLGGFNMWTYGSTYDDNSINSDFYDKLSPLLKADPANAILLPKYDSKTGLYRITASTSTQPTSAYDTGSISHYYITAAHRPPHNVTIQDATPSTKASFLGYKPISTGTISNDSSDATPYAESLSTYVMQLSLSATERLEVTYQILYDEVTTRTDDGQGNTFTSFAIKVQGHIYSLQNDGSVSIHPTNLDCMSEFISASSGTPQMYFKFGVMGIPATLVTSQYKNIEPNKGTMLFFAPFISYSLQPEGAPAGSNLNEWSLPGGANDDWNPVRFFNHVPDGHMNTNNLITGLSTDVDTETNYIRTISPGLINIAVSSALFSNNAKSQVLADLTRSISTVAGVNINPTHIVKQADEENNFFFGQVKAIQMAMQPLIWSNSSALTSDYSLRSHLITTADYTWGSESTKKDLSLTVPCSIFAQLDTGGPTADIPVDPKDPDDAYTNLIYGILDTYNAGLASTQGFHTIRHYIVPIADQTAQETGYYGDISQAVPAIASFQYQSSLDASVDTLEKQILGTGSEHTLSNLHTKSQGTQNLILNPLSPTDVEDVAYVDIHTSTTDLTVIHENHPVYKNVPVDHTLTFDTPSYIGDYDTPFEKYTSKTLHENLPYAGQRLRVRGTNSYSTPYATRGFDIDDLASYTHADGSPFLAGETVTLSFKVKVRRSIAAYIVNQDGSPYLPDFLIGLHETTPASTPTEFETSKFVPASIDNTTCTLDTYHCKNKDLDIKEYLAFYHAGMASTTQSQVRNYPTSEKLMGKSEQLQAVKDAHRLLHVENNQNDPKDASFVDLSREDPVHTFISMGNALEATYGYQNNRNLLTVPAANKDSLVVLTFDMDIPVGDMTALGKTFQMQIYSPSFIDQVHNDIAEANKNIFIDPFSGYIYLGAVKTNAEATIHGWTLNTLMDSNYYLSYEDTLMTPDTIYHSNVYYENLLHMHRMTGLTLADVFVVTLPSGYNPWSYPTLESDIYGTSFVKSHFSTTNTVTSTPAPARLLNYTSIEHLAASYDDPPPLQADALALICYAPLVFYYGSVAQTLGAPEITSNFALEETLQYFHEEQYYKAIGLTFPKPSSLEGKTYLTNLGASIQPLKMNYNILGNKDLSKYYIATQLPVESSIEGARVGFVGRIEQLKNPKFSKNTEKGARDVISFDVRFINIQSEIIRRVILANPVTFTLLDAKGHPVDTRIIVSATEFDKYSGSAIIGGNFTLSIERPLEKEMANSMVAVGPWTSHLNTTVAPVNPRKRGKYADKMDEQDL